MLDDERRRQAFEMLWTHWREGRRLRALPPDLRPATPREGYAIQAWIESQNGEPIAGWKLAATSREGQAHIGVDRPLAGRLPAGRVVHNGATVELGASHMRVAELEFVFRLGRDIRARTKPYAMAEVMDAVEALHLGIELPDSRFEDFAAAGAPQLVADAACANHFVLGPAAPPFWRDVNLATHPVKGVVVGRYSCEGRGGNALGDPRNAMTWLANELGEIGATLKAGEFVTTGTCVKPMPISAGDLVTGDFGPLGSASVRIA